MRVGILCVHSSILFYQFSPSVCQFFRLSNSAIMSKRMHIVISVRGIILLFYLRCRYKIPREPLLAGLLNTSGGNCLLSPFVSETVRDRSNTNRESQIGDRSMSFPMTLSDFESRDAKGQTFPEDLRITVRPFDVEQPNLPVPK